MEAHAETQSRSAQTVGKERRNNVAGLSYRAGRSKKEPAPSLHCTTRILRPVYDSRFFGSYPRRAHMNTPPPTFSRDVCRIDTGLAGLLLRRRYGYLAGWQIRVERQRHRPQVGGRKGAGDGRFLEDTCFGELEQSAARFYGGVETTAKWVDGHVRVRGLAASGIRTLTSSATYHHKNLAAHLECHCLTVAEPDWYTGPFPFSRCPTAVDPRRSTSAPTGRRILPHF